MPHDGRTARSQMFGRKVRPLSFWMGYFTCFLILGFLLDSVTGTLLNGIIGNALVIPSAAAFAALFGGFWLRSERMMTWGLLISTGLWGSVAIFALVETWSSSISGWIAAGLCGLSGWAWWIEIDEGREGKDVGGLESSPGRPSDHGGFKTS